MWPPGQEPRRPFPICGGGFQGARTGAGASGGARDDEERYPLPALCRSAHHDQEPVPLRADFCRWDSVIGEGVNAPDPLTGAHLIAEFEERFPNAVLRT